MRDTAIGDRHWLVEWLPRDSVPVTESGDNDPDGTAELHRTFVLRDDATAFARSVLPSDYWGSVQVTLYERQIDELDDMPCWTPIECYALSDVDGELEETG